MPIKRDEARRLSSRAAEPRFDADEVEAGMGGCPWRIAVCGILRHTAAEGARRRAVEAVLRQYPTPELLVAVKPDLLLQELHGVGVRLPSRASRLLQTMSYQWTTDDWETMYDLSGVGHDTADALIRFAAGHTES